MLSKIVGFVGAWFISGMTSSYWDKKYDSGICKGRALKRFIQEKEEFKELETQKTES